MGLDSGKQLGPYEILSPLGAGGMGEVYRARDTRLDRDVAIKVLPTEVANDAERLQRFQREAKAVAALSHPNILSLYEFDTADGLTYAVMELLEGETLREHMEGGPIPERKAVEIASQVAQGLAAAHDKGIVHRDLKPDNIFVAPDGRVKILDFGLAKPQTSNDDADNELATAMATAGPETTPGMVVGTAAYMSPEQVRGEQVDHRSDIFSFGVVLYEMLSGKRPFQGASAVETMTAVLREEPRQLAEFDTGTNAALGRITQRCLEKRREQRFQSARDLSFGLINSESISTSAIRLSGDQPAVATRSNRQRILFVASWILLGTAIGVFASRSFKDTTPSEPVRIQPLTFSGRDWSPSVAPNGDMIAFVSDRDGTPRIWLKQLNGGGEAALTSGPDAVPRFSPDGASVLYSHAEPGGRSLYRIGIVGGQARKIIDNAFEGDWSRDGSEVAFVRALGAEGAEVGIVDVRSGSSRIVATNDNLTLFGLRWSPDDDKLVVCTAQPTGVVYRSFMIIDPRSGKIDVRETPEGMPTSAPAWSGSELVVAVATSRLAGAASSAARVIRYDPRNGTHAVLFWGQDLVTQATGATAVEIIGPGRIVFDQFAIRQSLAEVALDDNVRVRESRPLTRGRSRDRQPAYSPDGLHVLFSSNRSGNLDLWLLDTMTGAVRQITDDAAEDWDPDFSPDGSQILWSSSRSGSQEIWMANADGSNARQVSHDGLDAENPTGTPDLGWIVYSSSNPAAPGIWKIRPDGTEAQRLVEGTLALPEVSPDGRYATFLRADLGRFVTEVRVVDIESGELVPFAIDVPFHRGDLVITVGRPRWLPDGRSLAFVALDDLGRSGIYAQEFAPGKNTDHTRRILAGFSDDYGTESFDISRDGRLLVSRLHQLRSLMLASGVPGLTRDQPTSEAP